MGRERCTLVIEPNTNNFLFIYFRNLMCVTSKISSVLGSDKDTCGIEMLKPQIEIEFKKCFLTFTTTQQE